MLENTRNCGVFDQAKKATYRRWLENPNSLVEGDTINQQNRDWNSRYAVLTQFQLDQGCIYRKAEQCGNTLIRPRYVALNSNALEIIQKEHRALIHYSMFILYSILYIILLINIGVEKIYKQISENYYSITKANIAQVIKHCNVCSLNAAAKSKALVKPILSSQCLDRIQFDLIDFQATPDYEFNWILQIKDTFSRYIQLIPLVDKNAETVAKAFDIWIGQNGRARRL